MYNKELEKEQYIKELENQNAYLLYKNKELKVKYDELSNSKSWKLTYPMRLLLYNYKKLKKLKYQKYYNYKVSNIELERQRNQKFSKEIKFSILVPLYNTPINFLKDMINSVINQTYFNWELCLADGSENCDNVQKVCLEYVKEDNRIKYRKLKENKGISENTNACIEMATGNYLSLLDHDDILHETALYEVAKVINEQNVDIVYTDEASFKYSILKSNIPYFKPDYSPDMLRSYNYICHFLTFNKELLSKLGNFRKEFDGSQDYDFILRLTEITNNIFHIPKVLYYWRAHQNSVAGIGIEAKPYAINAGKLAVKEHLKRIGLNGIVEEGKIPTTYRIKYKINNKLVSIIIPNCDHIEDLNKCIKSILNKTTYKNYEIIIIENNSTKKETSDYYKYLIKSYENIKIIKWDKEFNYSAINNFGAKYSKGEYLLLLNNDIEVITPNWIEEMLMFAQREDVGAVGAMLYYPNNKIQHAGVIIGINGIAGHSHKNFNRGENGYFSRLSIVQNLSAVTGACMLVSKEKFYKVQGLDERFKVDFNDIDFCMKLRDIGYYNVFTPYAELYHYESKSRGYKNTKSKKKRFYNEIMLFQNKWAKEILNGDPFYNPNLTLNKEDFSLK